MFRPFYWTILYEDTSNDTGETSDSSLYVVAKRLVKSKGLRPRDRIIITDSFLGQTRTFSVESETTFLPKEI